MSDPHTEIREALMWAPNDVQAAMGEVLARLEREAAERETALEQARDTKRELHRAAQAAESLAANANAETVERLDVDLARCKVERHDYRNQVAFMRSERSRLKSSLHDAEARVREVEAELERASRVTAAHAQMILDLHEQVREVEAERDEAHKKIGEDRETRWTMQRHLDVAAERLAEYEATVARQAEALREIAERGSDEAGWWNADVARAVLASPEAAATEPREQCRATSGTYRCERWAGHEGQHEGFPDAVWGPPEPAALPAVDAPPEPTT